MWWRRVVLASTDVAEEHRLQLQGETLWVALVHSEVVSLDRLGREHLATIYSFSCLCLTAEMYSRLAVASSNVMISLLRYGRLIITFDETTACQLYLRANRHNNGDTVARCSLPRPSWGTSSLWTKAPTLMEAICSSATSVLTRTTRRRHIPEDSILHYYHRVHLKSYIALTDWTL
jgi:hypothetical protein